MLAFTSRHEIHLSSSGRQRACIPAFDTEQNQLRHIAEVKSNATAIRTAVPANLMPDKVGLVGEAPCLQYRQPVRQQCIWAPQIKMRCGSRHLLDWKRFDVLELQCAISQKALV